MSLLKHRLAREIIGIVFFALAVFVFVSLITYSSHDPSFNHIIEVKAVHNLTGRFGSYLAALLLTGFGWVAFLFPLILGLAGFHQLSCRPWSGCRLIGLFLFLPSACGFLALSLRVRLFGDFLPGGALGRLVIDSKMVSYFNIPGMYIIVLTCLAISLILLTQSSVLELVFFIKSALARTFFWRRNQAKTDRLPKGEKRKKRKLSARSKSKEKQAEPDGKISLEEILASQKGALPPLSLLEQPGKRAEGEDERSLNDSSRKLEEKLLNFGVQGKIVQALPGPVVTRYEFEPAPGIKISKISNLSDDLALAMKALSVRIVAPVPGKSVVGLEIPNQKREIVYLRQILESEPFNRADSKLTLALGKDIAGVPYVTNLVKMPHLLIAGTTGSGKSVSINTIICSILFNATASEVKFIMIDPKMLELGIYNDIPHLLTPVVVNPKEAASALRWATQEMENRYRILSEKSVRNIAQYNRLILSENKQIKAKEEALSEAEAEPSKPLPYIVIVIDEFADLMIMSAKEVETLLIRLAQMARAVGIHLIIATQRPSVDVVTGLIKANFPSRISFRVSSRTDSRTILDANGAERLLGQGDMLFLPPGCSDLIRLHGSAITEDEIKRLVKYLSVQGKPEYDESILTFSAAEAKSGNKQDDDEYDELYDKAVDLVIKTRQASISMIQRRLRIGYNRAARMIEVMERDGVVSKPHGSKPREVLIGSDYER